MAGVSFTMAAAVTIAMTAAVSALGECRLYETDSSSSDGRKGKHQAEACRTNDGMDFHVHFLRNMPVAYGSGHIQQIMRTRILPKSQLSIPLRPMP